MAATDDSLAELVQSLPAELYTEIYQLTFTESYVKAIPITYALAPPSILQVDRASRAIGAASYYSTHIFYGAAAASWTTGWAHSRERTCVTFARCTSVRLPPLRCSYRIRR